jgi:hypothetical protein
MMRSRWNRWPSRVGAAVLIGGLVLANYGGGITPAEAQDRDKHDYDKDAYSHQNPFKQILDKLNEIQAKLKGGGGGGGAGSYTLRWDTNNPSASRFTVLTDFNNAAVRDNNTGLVWEQMPLGTASWSEARGQCIDKSVGGTRGWRLPSVAELASLIDPSLPAPSVPSYAFTGVQLNPYWSATSSGDSTNPYGGMKFTVDFQSGQTGVSGKTNPALVWCVRGAMNEPVY